MTKDKTKWHMYQDPSYYDMWAVAPVDDHDFNSPRLFHFYWKPEAEDFLRLMELAVCSVKE